jgi:hypothetical protein
MRSDWVGAPLCRLYSLDQVHHQVRKVSATTSASGRAPAYGSAGLLQVPFDEKPWPLSLIGTILGNAAVVAISRIALVDRP